MLTLKCVLGGIPLPVASVRWLANPAAFIRGYSKPHQAGPTGGYGMTLSACWKIKESVSETTSANSRSMEQGNWIAPNVPESDNPHVPDAAQVP